MWIWGPSGQGLLPHVSVQEVPGAAQSSNHTQPPDTLATLPLRILTLEATLTWTTECPEMQGALGLPDIKGN